MLWILGVILTGLGFYILLARTSLSDWMVGCQLAFLGLSAFFTQTAVLRSERVEGQLGAIYVILLGALMLFVLLGLSVRRFILSRNVKIDPPEDG